MFVLKPHTGSPIYRQLVDQIRRLVASGQLAPGAALPSIRDLAVRHAINPMTVSKAYSLLEAEGVLERHRGMPMTVAYRPRARAPHGERLEALEPHLDNLILAGQQLELGADEITEALHAKWEKRNGRAVRTR